MKKFTIVLLIAVLAMTSVFADPSIAFKGTAEANYVVDLDDKDFRYSAGNPTYSATFTFTGATASKAGAGEKLLTAEAVAKLTWKATEQTGAVNVGIANTTKVGTFTPSLESFVVKYGDLWTLNLLTAKAVGNYAISPLDYNATAKKYYDDAYTFSSDAAKGVTFTWNDFTFAGSANGDIDADESSDFYLGMETPNFGSKKVTENKKGFSVKAAAAFNYTGSKDTTYDSWKLTGSFDAKYTSPVMTYEVKADNAVTLGKKPVIVAEKGKVAYDADALFTANFKPADATTDFAALSVYFAKNASNTVNSFKNLLSAKVNFDMNCFTAPVTVEVKALNMLNAAKIVSAKAGYTFKAGHTLTVYGEDLLGKDGYDDEFTTDQKSYYKENYAGQKVGIASTLTFGADRHVVAVALDDYFRIATKELGAKATVDYKYYYFTVSTTVEGETDISKTNTAKFADKSLLKLTASVTSDKIVIENATASLKYESGNLLRKYAEGAPYSSESYSTAVKAGLGTVTASLKITF